MKRILIAAAAVLCVVSAPGPQSVYTPSIAVAQAAGNPDFGVGPQYDTTHVYVRPEDFDGFVASLVATFGGTTTKKGVFTVTPTPGKTMSQLVLTPVGSLSVFGFETPVPYPFGAERTGYLVTDLNAAVRAAQAEGANVLVSPFDDPIGKDVVVQWPGGVNMQLYWHTKAPSYAPLRTIPENRVYVSSGSANAFVRSFLAFSRGKLVSDDAHAPGIEIGRASETYRRIRLSSAFGTVAVLASNGQLPWPYGREITGYEVANLADTLGRAESAGVSVLVRPYTANGRSSVMVQFPGGYIAEIHSAAGEK
jgi:predicted enzyme related to lactoylglutathione lyase